jgi:hypothetical protein
MSSGGGGGGDQDLHGLYHQHGHGHLTRSDDASTGYQFSSNDMESFFFSQQPVGIGGSGGSADEIVPYSSMTDYLQGFLDPAGLVRHLDLPSQDVPTKHELSVDVRSHDRDSQGTGSAAGEGAALLTPKSSVSFSSSGGEGEGKSRRCRKGPAKEADEEDAKDQKDDEENVKKV